MVRGRVPLPPLGSVSAMGPPPEKRKVEVGADVTVWRREALAPVLLAEPM